MTIVLMGTFIGLSKAQTNECIKDFDFLVQKIKADYSPPTRLQRGVSGWAFITHKRSNIIVDGLENG